MKSTSRQPLTSRQTGRSKTGSGGCIPQGGQKSGESRSRSPLLPPSEPDHRSQISPPSTWKSAGKPQAPEAGDGDVKKFVTFELLAAPGSEVYIAGTFNDWNPQQHPLKPVNGDGLYRATLPLPAGRYEYKFVVNHTWIPDPVAGESVPNGLGDSNSLLTVG